MSNVHVSTKDTKGKSDAWPLVTLADVFNIARGGSPRPIDAYITEDPSGINWILISDATGVSKYITGTKKRITGEGAKRSRHVQPGDFLLTNSMSFGRPYIMRTYGCIHDGWLVLSPSRRDVDTDFFYHLLSSKAIYSEFERRACGATVKNLSIDLVKGVKIHLPPLNEQRRIATILDKADELRAKRRAALEQLNGLTQAIFLEMFGDPATNPKGWTVVTLGDICARKPNNGIFRKNEDYGHGIPVVWVEELFRGNEIDTSQSRQLTPTDDELRRYALTYGDILFCRSSLKLGGIGFNNVYLGQDAEALFECHVIRVSPDVRRAEPRFLNALLRMPSQRQRLFQQAKTVTMTTIDQQGLLRINIPLPRKRPRQTVLTLSR